MVCRNNLKSCKNICRFDEAHQALATTHVFVRELLEPRTSLDVDIVGFHHSILLAPMRPGAPREVAADNKAVIT